METEEQPNGFLPHEQYRPFRVGIKSTSNALKISWNGPEMPKIFLEIKDENTFGKTFLQFGANQGFAIVYKHLGIQDELDTEPLNSAYSIAPDAYVDFGGKIQGGQFYAKSPLQVLYTPIRRPGEERAWSLPPTPFEGSLNIIGENPPLEAIKEYINETEGQIIYNIIRDFSGLKMFDSNGEPTYNHTRMGYGLFSIENSTSAERWNWKANIDNGMNLFNDYIKKSIQYSKDTCISHKGLPSLSEFQLKVNAAQMFDNDNNWIPKKVGYLFWKKWKWVEKIQGANRLGDRVRQN
jgi:hypothetical protein